MRSLQGLKRSLSIIMAFLMFPLNGTAYSATRAENIKTIEMYLNLDSNDIGIAENGETDEWIIKEINGLSSDQLENLVAKAEAQSYQASDSGGDSHFWRNLIIAWLVLFLVITGGVLYLFGAI